MTEYIKPASLAEALAARAAHPDYELIAGCTDVMVTLPHRPAPVGWIDLFALPELCGIHVDDHHLKIGAATTYAAILQDDGVRATLPSLWQCVREIGAAQIQARGTIGGNVATSSPVGDTLPVLLALDASVLVSSVRGTRTVPYDAFCTGYRKTALAADEIICAITIPLAAGQRVQFWRKVGTRQAQAISKVTVAASAALTDGCVTTCRIAMGAVADRPIRLPNVEAILTGVAPTDDVAGRVAEAAMSAIRPIDDVRSTADYRRAVAANLVRRFVLALA